MADPASDETYKQIRVYEEDHRTLKIRQARNGVDRLPDVISNILNEVDTRAE